MPEIFLETAIDCLTFNGDTGSLISMRPKALADTELVATGTDDPVFALQYIDDDNTYCYVDSGSAAKVDIACDDSDAGQTLTISFACIAALDVDVVLTVRTTSADPCARWSCQLRNHGGMRIVDVQFPFLIVSDAGAVVEPTMMGGQLLRGAGLQEIVDDAPERWQFIPQHGGSDHYPGELFAQFLAWYNDCAGVYLACYDCEGNVKRMRPVRRDSGIRLGMAHLGDWPTVGQRTIEYDVVTRSFEGDWYDAADIYRSWSLDQKWGTPLARRTDIPDWLLDSPPNITIRLQGHLDEGVVFPVEEFLPYEKCVPFLEAIERRVDAPLVAVIMSWERGGPWVYPDCFPPVGGDESLARFVAMARQRGWHVGSFCNGTRWVMEHVQNGYDGREFFEKHNGAASVCRTHDGEPWPNDWDAEWRPSYHACMAHGQTKDLAEAFVKRLIGWGMESVQFFDQNFNGATFQCFAGDHGHPPGPGKWMAAAMEEMMRAFHQLAADAGATEAFQSVEAPCNEYCLPLFQQCDVRPSTPGSGEPYYIPLFHYLFHECIIINGMMNIGGEPYALPMRNAWNGVWGEIPGAVMIGDGTLLNRETFNWATWEPKVGSNDDALEMIRTVSAMRRGPGCDFLVFGRMQRPARLQCEIVKWTYNERNYEVPAVAQGAWKTPDGRFGIVLANWTTRPQKTVINDTRLSGQVTVDSCGASQEQEILDVTDGQLDLSLPPMSCVLVAETAAGRHEEKGRKMRATA